jgi:hypothetical protein
VVVVWDKRVNEHIYIHLLGKRGSEGVLGRNTLWLSQGMTAQEQSVMCWSALILHGCNCPLSFAEVLSGAFLSIAIA